MMVNINLVKLNLQVVYSLTFINILLFILLLLVKYSITYLYYSFYREMRLLNFVLYITTVASPASLVWRHCYTVIAYPAPVATATLICVQEMFIRASYHEGGRISPEVHLQFLVFCYFASWRAMMKIEQIEVFST